MGEEGQRKLKGASVLVSRIGGLGGIAAYELAAAGVGRLILAHAGNIQPADLNRQLLMTYDALGTSRVECAARRLRELNPRVEVVAIPENVSAANADRLVALADVVIAAAPPFAERSRCTPRRCARETAGSGDVRTVRPGGDGAARPRACLACRVPSRPDWSRQFRVFSAVSTAGCPAAVEVIKPITDRRTAGRPVTRVRTAGDGLVSSARSVALRQSVASSRGNTSRT